MSIAGTAILNNVKVGQHIRVNIVGIGWVDGEVLDCDDSTVTVRHSVRGQKVDTSYKRSHVTDAQLAGNSKNWRQFRD